ncbi:hypothetical protein FB451DRAFT_1446070 [Mycena latifolia]|nr:hypothetical protein FB451DRAFT_1446070 [Mycena latifolia]
MFSRRFSIWVSLAIVLVNMDGTANAQTASTISSTGSQRRHTQYNVNYYYARQLMPSPLSSSSSYDYWWPYPPGGVTTATSSTTWSPSPPTDTLLSATGTSTPALSFPFASDSAITSSSDSLSSTSASSASSSTPSSSSSASILSISALPPSNTSLPATSHHKLSMAGPSNLVYIVPVCAVVGVLIGGITAWCVYGCLTRNGHGRRRGRKSYGTLEVGPEYTPPSPRPGEKEEDEEADWVGDEKLVEESDDEHDAARGAASDEEPGTGTETEGFLHPGSAHTQKRPARSMRTKSAASATTVSTAAARAKSTRSSRAPSPTPSGRTSLFFDRPDPSDALPWESLRHKSIKRGILARLKYDGEQDTNERVARRAWQAHGRHDSDLLVADAHADLSRAASVSAAPTSSSAALSRASSAATGPGFRMLTESPAQTPKRERGAEVFAWPRMEEEDRYTRIPTRVARSRSRSPEKPSRAASPEKFTRGMSPDKLARAASPPVRRGGVADGNNAFNGQMRGRTTDIVNGAAHILPQSPPRISSPVLDGALCFTPIPSPSFETTPTIPSFASFGGPAAEVEYMGRGAEERARGGERRRHD